MQKAFIYAATVFFCLEVSSAAQAQIVFQGFEGTGVKWHDYFCAGTETPLVGDFNGDGKDDLVTLTKGTAADAFVALSNGTNAFTGTGVKWNDNICSGSDIAVTGDFNGDGKDDIATFTRGTTADVFVYLSTGSSFKAKSKWHDSFCSGTEIPLAGDFNGDGKDDIVTFTRGTAGDVFVALSNGTSAFIGPATAPFIGTPGKSKWHDSFCYGTEIPLVGDFNGDGKDDIVAFTRGTAGDVFVALSNGTDFIGTGVKWHDSFCYGTEIPLVGDFNGDGKDDIVTFTRGTAADVFVAFANYNNTEFNGTGVKAHDYFCAGTEIPLAGKFNTDRPCDIATLTRGTAADVFVALANVSIIK